MRVKHKFSSLLRQSSAVTIPLHFIPPQVPSLLPTSPLLNLDSATFGLLLGDEDAEQAVLHICLDIVVVDWLGEREDPRERANTALRYPVLRLLRMLVLDLLVVGSVFVLLNSS